MEAKLEAYRTKKRREAMVEKAKHSIKGVLSWEDQPVPLLSQKIEVIYQLT